VLLNDTTKVSQLSGKKVIVLAIRHPTPTSWKPIGLPSLGSHSSVRQLIFPPYTLDSPTFE
jgi:hypothetical protein